MNTRGWAALILVATAVGCSGGSGGGETPNSGAPGSGPAVSYCDSACNKLSTCDASADFVTCRASCDNETAAVTPKLRPEYVNALTACYTAKDCATVLQGGAVSGCADQAAATLAPTAIGMAFCSALDSAFVKCGSAIDAATCLTVAKQYSDFTLSNAQGCTSKACNEIGACVNAQLGIDVVTPNDNSCFYAYDDECDEGAACSAGTDTYDCSHSW